MGKLVMAVFCCGLYLIWAGVRIVDNITFDRNVEGYLKRAADSNTIGLARENLETALWYIEKENMTTGYTSVFWNTPGEEVTFWYKNLKKSLGELQAVNPEASQLETSNVLMKLRETLLDHGPRGDKVTAPNGISVYPYNVLYAWWAILSGLGTITFFAAFVYGKKQEQLSAPSRKFTDPSRGFRRM